MDRLGTPWRMRSGTNKVLVKLGWARAAAVIALTGCGSVVEPPSAYGPVPAHSGSHGGPNSSPDASPDLMAAPSGSSGSGASDDGASQGGTGSASSGGSSTSGAGPASTACVKGKVR